MTERAFDSMDPQLRERWKQIIESGTPYQEVKALLCVPYRVINQFRDEVMPWHKWPDTRSVEQRRAEFAERQERRREAKSGSPQSGPVT